jgi:NTP-dependent ternary system trypsin peptidase co-occuring protein
VSPVAEIPLADGGSILVEVDRPSDGPAVRGRSGAPALLDEPLEQMVAGLGPASRAVLAQLRALADGPEEIQIEFAIKLTADARMVIARAGGEANFRISLKWTREAERARVSPDAEGRS